jgi:hypothetical protein
MVAIGDSPLIRFPTPLRIAFTRLRKLGRRQATAGSAAQRTDPLLEAGMILRKGREQQGLSLRDLALETRISTPVLEAMERGWRDRLPEITYLRTMLPLLERRLALAPGSLNAVLPAQRTQHVQRQGLVLRFTPGSIDVFTTWQGTLLYALITVGLIYGLNLQQQRLANAGLLTVAPLPAQPDPINAPTKGKQLLLQAHPDLRPLDQAAAGQAIRLWRRASSP